MNKERINNFSREELIKLKELLEKYSVIMNKKTDHTSAKQKNEAWCQLTSEFNSNNLVYRTQKQLIYKFNNMKKNARKELSEEKKERRSTGGGPPQAKPSDTSEWLCSIMAESIVGLPSTHDSDLTLDNAENGEAVQQNVALPNVDDEFYFEENNKDINDTVKIMPILNAQESQEVRVFSNNEDAVKFDTSTPYSMLHKPVSKALESGNRKRKLIFTPQETRKKIVTMANEKELYFKNKVLNEKKLLEFAEEEHSKNMLLKQLILKKAAVELEIEEEKLKKIKNENKDLS